MTIERALRLIAGSFVLVGAALALWVHVGWLALPAFVGLNLVQSAFTDWCPMVWILKAFGLPRCAASRA